MNKLLPKDYLIIIRKIEEMRDNVVNKKKEIISTLHEIDPDLDARVTSLSKLVNVLNSLQLSLILISNHLLHKVWWKNIVGKNNELTDQDIQHYINEFISFTKIGFIQTLFSTVESSLRIFLRALDPAACNRGTDAFKSIYDCLLRNKLSKNPNEGTELLDLLRLIRNTIHNNGIYFDRNGDNKLVIWQGNQYDFINSKPVDFISWEFLLRISEATIELIFEVIQDAKIIQYKETIIDPFSNHNN